MSKKKKDTKSKQKKNKAKKTDKKSGKKSLPEDHPMVIEAKEKTTVALSQAENVLSTIDFDAIFTPSTLNSIAQAQKTLQAFANLHQNTFGQIAEMQKSIVDTYTLPMRQFQESIKSITTMQNNIASIGGLYQNTVQDAVLNSGIMQIANTFKSIQIEAFGGLYIRSELQDNFESLHNGLTQVSKIQETKLLRTGQVKLGIHTQSESISTQVVYKSVKEVDTRLEFTNETLSTTKNEVSIIRQRLDTQESLLQVLFDNPFPYFRINKVNYVKSSSQFVVNDSITVDITSKTRIDYLCQVLFSGKKENLYDEWDFEDILAEMTVLMNYSEEASRITWKQMQGYISDLNSKIAKKTTKEDIVLIPRTETVQLNPLYFAK